VAKARKMVVKKSGGHFFMGAKVKYRYKVILRSHKAHNLLTLA